MYRQQKRGQAAMEFLMTYGWAILAAIIAIGVLAYFGVFNPSRLAGSTAVLNPPMNIDSFNIVSDDAACSGGVADCINLQVTQNGGQSVTVTSMLITLTSGATGVCTNRTAGPGSWVSGTPETLRLGCATAATGAGTTSIFGNGASIAANIEIKYTAGTSTLVQTSTGNVRGVAQ